jgi:hypothetical protein
LIRPFAVSVKGTSRSFASWILSVPTPNCGLAGEALLDASAEQEGERYFQIFPPAKALNVMLIGQAS